MKIADPYIKLVEWSEEDQCYVGSSPGFIGPCCHGSDEAKVYKSLCRIVAEWLEIHEKEGVSINQFISSAVSEKISALMTEDYLRNRATRAKKADFEKILAKVPGRKPLPGDER